MSDVANAVARLAQHVDANRREVVGNDLTDLRSELQQIAEQGVLPDGTSVSAEICMWAEGWLLTLVEVL